MNDRQRLEAIVSVVCKYLPPDGISISNAMNEIISLVDPLPAKPAQEPVGMVKELFTQTAWEKLDLRGNTKVYITPPQRKPLTDERLEMIWRDGPYSHGTLHDFRLAARAIEAAHGIKE